MKDATKIYKITCFLMFGIFLTQIGTISLFMQWQDGKSIDDAFSWYVPLRQLFMAVPLWLYAVHVTRKIRGGDRDYYP